MTTTRFMVVMTLIGLTMSFSMAPALAAVSVGKGELKGSTLRIEGEDAVSGSTVTVRSSDSLAAVQADNRGRWEIQANNFPVPDCLVVVDDGTCAFAGKFRPFGFGCRLYFSGRTFRNHCGITC